MKTISNTQSQNRKGIRCEKLNRKLRQNTRTACSFLLSGVSVCMCAPRWHLFALGQFIGSVRNGRIVFRTLIYMRPLVSAFVNGPQTLRVLRLVINLIPLANQIKPAKPLLRSSLIYNNVSRIFIYLGFII